MNKPLWQPSEKLKENSLLKGFCKFINFKSSNNFKEIWQWSIDNPNDFWSKFWDYSKIIGDKGSEIIKKHKVPLDISQEVIDNNQDEIDIILSKGHL